MELTLEEAGRILEEKGKLNLEAAKAKYESSVKEIEDQYSVHIAAIASKKQLLAAIQAFNNPHVEHVKFDIYIIPRNLGGEPNEGLQTE